MTSNDQSEIKPAQDLLAGIFFIFLGGYMVALSVMLDRPTGWVSAPGLTPMLVFLTVSVLGASLARRAIREGGWTRIGLLLIRTGWAHESTSKIKITFLIVALFLYYIVAIHYLPFVLSTSLFLFACFWVFYSRDLLRNAGIAIVMSLAISIIFVELFDVYLPGTEWIDLLPPFLRWEAG